MSSIVGLFTDVLPAGGVQRASRHVAAVTAQFASDRGMTVRFVSLNDPHESHTVRVGSMEFSVSGYARSKTQFAMAAWNAAGCDPSLVIALHPHLAPIVQMMKTRNRKFHSIVFTHGVEVWQPLGWLRGAALRSADLVVGPSSDTVQRLVSVQRIHPSNVRLLPWGLDPEFEVRVQSGVSLEPPPGFPRANRTILTVGRWDSNEKYKGADTLISALPRVLKATPDVSLVLVGGGSDRPRLEQLAADLRVSDRTHFLEGLTAEQLSACYANCDVFALPSSGEGFGLVFLEALAYGKPAVGGAHGGIPDILEDGVTGVQVPHGNVERLGQALESILQNAARSKEMGVRGRDRVARDFSFARFHGRLTEILRAVLAREH